MLVFQGVQNGNIDQKCVKITLIQYLGEIPSLCHTNLFHETF